MNADRLISRLRPGWVDPAGVTGGGLARKLTRRFLPLTTRWALARLRWDAVDGVKGATESARTLGWPAVAQLRWADLAGNCSIAQRHRIVRIPGYPHLLYFREGSSDPRVMEQVFGRQEYRCLAYEPGVRFIVDCGANVGYTSAYLLHRYPAVRIAVIEPDRGNLAVCRKNLQPFGNRVTFFQAGIWGESGAMTMDRTGSEWAFKARPARIGEMVEFDAMTIADVMKQVDFPRIDVLKIDIEGAEENVFAGNARDWIRRVKTMAIELHGDACERAVVAALNGMKHERSTSGELTVFRMIDPSRLAEPSR